MERCFRGAPAATFGRSVRKMVDDGDILAVPGDEWLSAAGAHAIARETSRHLVNENEPTLWVLPERHDKFSHDAGCAR